jgi:Fic/DOC family
MEDFDTRLGGLPRPLEAEEIWADIWVHEAHHSTAIEGNTLVLRQVDALLREGRAVGNKDLAEYLEVQGYAEAARWVYGEAAQRDRVSGVSILTVTEVRQVHQKALGPVWNVAPHPQATPEESPGAWRRHDISPFPGGMTPPPFPDVAPQMTDLVRRANRLERSPELPERLAELHCLFEQIHPFLDGNGRTGRLVMNLILVRLGYPPAILYTRDRGRYLRALRRGDGGDPGPLGELLARAVLNNLHRFVIPAVAGPNRLVPLAALGSRQRTVASLRQAATRGRLRAVKNDSGQWLSSLAWLSEYEKSRYRRH